MRRIQSGKEIESKKQRRARIFTIVMLLILLASSAGYAFLSNPNDSKTTKGQGDSEQLGVNVGGQYVYLINSKNKSAEVPVKMNLILGDYSGKKVYVVANNSAVSNEISSTIGRYSNGVGNACYGSCSENLPEKTCKDMLIVWKPAEQNKVYQNESCIFIEGDMRAVDAFIYRIFE